MASRQRAEHEQTRNETNEYDTYLQNLFSRVRKVLHQSQEEENRKSDGREGDRSEARGLHPWPSQHEMGLAVSRFAWPPRVRQNAGGAGGGVRDGSKVPGIGFRRSRAGQRRTEEDTGQSSGFQPQP